MSRRPHKVTTVLLCLLVGYTHMSQAYDDHTHNAINVGAILASSLDARLRDDLSFQSGTSQLIMGKRVIDWIGDAGLQEDIPITRTRNHFHQPLRSPWRSAGLNDGLLSGISSILWGQDPSQGFSWVSARKAYINALTVASPTEREKWFGETFRAIGQVMHLIADSSVPAHVRNDQHTGGDPYEEWVELQAEPQSEEKPEEARERFLGSFALSPLRPDRSILDIPILGQDAFDAPVPIARIWDTDRYDGTNPAITSPLAIGITEYANANFFSDDTVFANQLETSHRHFSPFPSTGDVEEWVDPRNNRKYWRKRVDAPGEPVQHLAAVSKRSFWRQSFGVDQEIRGGLDERVHEEYARLLIPRAVGYSAGLLDYFFRGTLDFTIGGSSPNHTLTVTNKSDEAMGGTFTLYADNFSDTRSAVAGASFNLNLGPGATSGAVNFTPAAEVQAYTLVFQGRLGVEESAVVGKVNEWYAVTDVTPGTIAAGQATTIKITVKSNFSRQARTFVAALFDGNAFKLASTSATIPETGPATTQISLDITSTTIPNIAPRPLSLVVGTDADIATITRADLRNQVPVNTMNLVRVGEASRLPIYQRLVTPQLLRVLAFPQSSILLTCTILGLETETITLKFKNAGNFIIQYLATSADHEPQSNFKNLTFDSSQAEFQTVTLKLDNLVNEFGQRAVNHILQMFGDLLTTDAFVCIQSISGIPDLQFGNCSFGTRWTLRECPE